MSNAFSRIKQGLEEANDFAQGNTGKVVVHEFNTIDVKNLRSKIGMSQN
jgi:putative transcriptional regulator